VFTLEKRSQQKMHMIATTVELGLGNMMTNGKIPIKCCKFQGTKESNASVNQMCKQSGFVKVVL
jgi:hypothetical protein